MKIKIIKTTSIKGVHANFGEIVDVKIDDFRALVGHDIAQAISVADFVSVFGPERSKNGLIAVEDKKESEEKKDDPLISKNSETKVFKKGKSKL